MIGMRKIFSLTKTPPQSRQPPPRPKEPPPKIPRPHASSWSKNKFLYSEDESTIGGSQTDRSEKERQRLIGSCRPCVPGPELSTTIWVQIRGPRYDPIKVLINYHDEMRVADLRDIIASHEELADYVNGVLYIYHSKGHEQEKLHPMKLIDFSVIGEDVILVKVIPSLETRNGVQDRKLDKLEEETQRKCCDTTQHVNNNPKNLHKILKEMLLPTSGLRKVGDKQHKQYMVANEIVDWLIKEKYAETREKAVEIGRALVQSSMIYDIRECGEPFKDNQTLYKALEVEVDFKTLLSPISMEIFDYDKSKIDTYTLEEMKTWLCDVNLREYGELFNEDLGSTAESSETPRSTGNDPEEKSMFFVDRATCKIILDKASREKSLELFLVHPQADLGHIFNINGFTQTFLCTFPSFMEPLNLLQFLILRFKDTSTLLIDKERIVFIINEWMNIDNGYDFSDSEMISTVEQLISSLNETQPYKRFNPISQFFQKKLNRIVHDKEERDCPRKFFYTLPPDPILPVSAKFQIFDVDPLELARQITLIVERYMLAMTRHELLKENFDPKNRKEKAPSIHYMVEFAEHLSGVCAAGILKESCVEMQALRYTYFVDVAEELRKLNNFYCVGCIIGALNGAAIPKLKKMLTSRYLDNKTIKKYELLKHLILPNPGQEVDPYKEAVEAINPNEPLVPLLHSRLGLGTLTRLNELQKDILSYPDSPSDCWINWQKLTKVAKIISNIKRSQTGYSLIDIPEIQQFIQISESWQNENINCQIAELRNNQEILPLENMARIGTSLLFDSEWIELNKKDWSTIIRVTNAKLIEFKDQDILDCKPDCIYRLIEGTIQIKRKEEITAQENTGYSNNSPEAQPSRANSIRGRSKDSIMVLQAKNTFGELSIFGITPSSCVVTGISSGKYYEIKSEKIIQLCLWNDTISRKFNYYIAYKVSRKSKHKKNLLESKMYKEDTNDKIDKEPEVSVPLNKRSSLTLDEEDWKLITHRIQPFYCKADDIILQKGSFCPKLYQIVSGSVKEANMGDYVSEYQKGDIFGEIGFVNTGVASATFVALEKTQLIVIEGYYLVVLFQHDPSLAGRFYHHLGKILYQRLIKDDPSTFI